MDRERAKELLPIIEAFAEGKTIEVRNPDAGFYDWDDVPEHEGLLFNASCEYRIKPEPREFWLASNSINIYGYGIWTDITDKDIPKVSKKCIEGVGWIKVREVLE